MPTAKNYEGLKYNKLTAIRFLRRDGYNKIWLFKCDCGNTHEARINNVVSGNTKQCLSCTSESRAKTHRTHDKSKTDTYKSYLKMKERCSDILDISYHNYGGRGIEVCSRWLESFENFYEDMGDRPVNSSLERTDFNLGYFKDNCKWLEKSMQSRNRRKSKNNTSGVNGVCYKTCPKTGNTYYVARWYVNKKLKSKSFLLKA